MILVDFLGWWYTHGYMWAIEQCLVVAPQKIAQFFSMKDLAKTLFAPFRQDALEGRGTSISVKFQVFFGNIISRIFGFIIRTALLIVGLFGIVLNIIVGIAAVVTWLFLPVMPIVALLIFLAGGINI